MGKIKISSKENTPGEYTRNTNTPAKARNQLSEGDLETHVYHYHRAGADKLNLFEVTMEPDTQLSPHGHKGDEILYVLEGEMRLGSRVLQPGTSVLIPGMTAYLVSAGPTGCRFLNFFGRVDENTYIHRDDLIKAPGSVDTVTAPHLIDE
jgi:quercetin dioxygenase-like cupin family protein